MKIGLNPGAPQGGLGEQYFLGSFEDRTFTPSENPGPWLHQLWEGRLLRDQLQWPAARRQAGADWLDEQLAVCRQAASLAMAGADEPATAAFRDDLDLIVDRSSVKAYVQDGTVAVKDLIFPLEETARVELFSAGGTT